MEKDIGLWEMDITQWGAVFKELIEKKEISMEALGSSFPDNSEFS